MPGRRKAMLWSRAPRAAPDRLGHPGLAPGRRGRPVTDTPIGPVRAVGAAVPWRDAHVRTGRRDRARWDDHLAYLEALGPPLAAGMPAGPPVLLRGDLNQRVPRGRQPRRVADALERALASLSVVTAGAVRGLDRPGVSHVALGPGPAADRVWGRSRIGGDGRGPSDHDGVAADPRRAGA